MANVMDSEAVQVVESSFVVSSEPTPSEGLWLSPLDLILANRGHTPTVYLYSSSSNAVAAADGFFDVARLKEAMAKTLVAFYPLAGRLGVNNDDGRAEITCTGEGALFVVAHADLTVGDIEDDFRSSPELRRLFVPRIEPASIILAIQVSSFCFFQALRVYWTLVHCLDIDNAAYACARVPRLLDAGDFPQVGRCALLGTALHHVAIDASSAFHFFQT
jgi:shikimate O-hydroxycinnamoyltransferase